MTPQHPKPRQPSSLGTAVGGNAVVSLGARALEMILLIAATPWMISLMGAPRYGILAIGLAVAAYASFMDPGLGQAVVALLPGGTIRGSRAGKNKMIGTALTFSLALSGIIFLLIAAAAWWLTGIFQIPAESRGEAYGLILWLSLSVVLQFPLSVTQGVLLHHHKGYLGQGISALMSLLRTACILAVLIRGADLPLIGAIYTGAAVLQLALTWGLARGVSGPGTLNPRWDSRSLRRLLGFGKSYFVSSLAGGVIVNADRTVLGIFQPVAILPYYTVPLGLASKLWEFPRAVLAPVAPALAQIYASGRTGRLAAAYERASRISIMGTVHGCTLLVCLAPQILDSWLGGEFSQRGSGPLRLLALGTFLSAVITPSVFLSLAAGKPGIGAKVHAWIAIFQVALLLALTPRWGALGAAWAWFLTHIIDLFLMMPRVHRATGMPPFGATLGRVLVKPALVSLGAMLLTLPGLGLATSFPRLLACLGASYLLHLGGCWFFVLDKRDKNQAKDLWAGLTGRRA